MRFGITEAHGKGNALQLNSFLDAGAVRVDGEGAFSVEGGKIKQAVAALARSNRFSQPFSSVHPDFREGPRAFAEKRKPNWDPTPPGWLAEETKA